MVRKQSLPFEKTAINTFIVKSLIIRFEHMEIKAVLWDRTELQDFDEYEKFSCFDF